MVHAPPNPKISSGRGHTWSVSVSKNCEKAVFKIKGRPTLFIPLKEVNVAAASASVDGLFDGAGQSNETLQKQKKVSLKTPATLVVFFNYNSRNRIRAYGYCNF